MDGREGREKERKENRGARDTGRKKKPRGRVGWKERSALDWKGSSCMGFRHSHPLAPSAGALAVIMYVRVRPRGPGAVPVSDLTPRSSQILSADVAEDVSNSL